ncbi:hypothetical protein [Paenibacillus sp. FSL H3-0286]|uniref:hypothetical protein n=1 Tax=Paenibacillus sp. FSL H3-0286 TaxID=2921427 RepID=UPI0032528058
MYTMDGLIAMFSEAEAYKAKYVAIKVSMDGSPEDEIIINPAKNISSKIEYYKNTYDEKLNHKFSKGIKIIDFSYGKSFKVIEEDLIY